VSVLSSLHLHNILQTADRVETTYTNVDLTPITLSVV